MNQKQLHHIIYSYVSENFGESEAQDPSWNIYDLADHIAKQFGTYEDENKKHNGWTNYATWRIQLEIVDDYFQGMLGSDEDWLKEQREMSVGDMAGCVKDIVEEAVGEGQQDGLAWNYAQAFLEEVNYNELAEHGLKLLNDEKKEV